MQTMQSAFEQCKFKILFSEFYMLIIL